MARLAILLLGTVLAAVAYGGGLGVSDAWIRLLPAGAPAGGYLTVRNDSKAPATLVGASTSAFGQAMMHRTIEEQGRSRMVHVGKVDVPAGGKLEFAPGGFHLMLTQPTRELSVGERISLTLEFSGGQKLTADFVVRGPAGQ